jgi:hypothetical protein
MPLALSGIDQRRGSAIGLRQRPTRDELSRCI